MLEKNLRLNVGVRREEYSLWATAEDEHCLIDIKSNVTCQRILRIVVILQANQSTMIGHNSRNLLKVKGE
jgi:hypothetical protein